MYKQLLEAPIYMQMCCSQFNLFLISKIDFHTNIKMYSFNRYLYKTKAIEIIHYILKDEFENFNYHSFNSVCYHQEEIKVIFNN